MSYSSVWTQLALPYSPVGSIPFVANDSTSIIIDALYFNYSIDGTPVPANPDVKQRQLTVYGGIRLGYADLTASPGASVIINRPAGKVAISAGSNLITVNCSYCTERSIVLLQLMTLDATLTRVIPSIADGQFLIVGNANATGVVAVEFAVLGTM